MNFKKLLILTDWFYPGYKGGGPIRSTVNLAMALQDVGDVYVLTSNTDFGDPNPYTGIATDSWQKPLGPNISVWYGRATLNYKGILQIIQELQPHFIYLNSMFSLQFTIFPLWMRWRKQVDARIVLAPRGMLHEGALTFKGNKKKLFLRLMKTLHWHRFIHFHATDQQEVTDIKKIFGTTSQVTLIPNLPDQKQAPLEMLSKKQGAIQLVFISRIHPKKNLLFVLQLLKAVSGKINFDIYGSSEDSAYTEDCNKVISQLPPEVKVTWKGPVENSRVPLVLQQAHLFILPTLGENFGHAIFEAFLAGRPVLISDQTPWQQLEQQQVGWDLPLDAPHKWQQTLQAAIDMDQPTFDSWCIHSWQFASRYIKNSESVYHYRQLLLG